MLLSLLLASCDGDQRMSMQYGKGEVYPPDQLYAVVEVPAGTSELFRFNFSEDRLEASGDTVPFLPFPGNYGFILRSNAFEQQLARTDHLSCLVLSSALNAQEILPVHPVGVLIMEDAGKRENLIICIPESEVLQTLKIRDFVDFMTDYDPVRFQIQHWFANFQGPNAVHIVGWEDEEYASRLIEQKGNQ